MFGIFDNLFDFNNDGKLDPLEQAAAFDLLFDDNEETDDFDDDDFDDDF